ncbi:MAG: beta-galactosidase [Ruminococcaceae bacterium]|nr:beta-galactosidase [Oscillospiraceae bacterium]
MYFRQVHLDFHTSEKIEEIGSRFQKEAFQRALKAGHVESVTLFSKCHHGWSYHPTEANEMHPHLSFDLFGEQIRAAQEIGVNVVGYLSAGLDEKFAVRHPECLARRRDESILRTADFTTAGYHLLCMNSPYLGILADQVREMCQGYPVSGVFLDIVKPTKCYCRNCVALMEAEGLDPENEAHVALMAEKTYAKYAKTMRAAVDSVDPSLTVFHNGGGTPRGRRDLMAMNSHIEIESLPTGGWGYDNLPLTARYVQPMDMDFLGMTGKFHLSWGEFGGYKHPNALIFETALAVANGGKCSVGDQLHPDGQMDEETYRIIGEAYRRIEEREPWLEGVRGVADIGLLSYSAWLASHPEEQAGDAERRLSDVGALRILLEGKYLFDVLDCESEFENYKLLILPDNVKIDGGMKRKLDRYVAAGGKLLASGRSGLLLDEYGQVGNFAYDLGVTHRGDMPMKPVYLSVEDKLEGIRPAGYVIYAQTQRAELTREGSALAALHEPYFARTAKHFCSHFHAPEKKEFAGVGVSEGKHGIYLASAMFREYAAVGSRISKQAVTAAIDRLLGENKTVTVELPAQGIVTLMEQGALERSVLHLLYAPRGSKGTEKLEIIEDAIPLYGVEVALKTRERAVARVYSAPEGENLAYTVDEKGVLRFSVPKVLLHAMVAIEWKKEEKLP